MNAQKFLDDWRAARDHVLRHPAEAPPWMKRANGTGEYAVSIDVAEHFLAPDAPAGDPETMLRLKQLYAVALYRASFTDKARAILEDLHAAGARDSETLGLLGSVYKILSNQSSNPEEKQRLLRASRDFYQLGFQATQNYYCGINAATLSILLDETEEGKRLANETLQALPPKEDAWSVATAAEAYLILEDIDKAKELYRRAVAIGQDRWADIASTRRQCRLLCGKMKGKRALLDSCFPSNNVGFFAGHMIDAPGRPKPRFPAESIPSVEKRIEEWLKRKDIRFAFSSAACGGDILFLEAAQRLGVETNIVLPFAQEFFLNTSVLQGGPEWRPRFENVLSNAASVTVINTDVPDYHASCYDFTNQMIAARAAQRAAASEGRLSALAVWDGRVGDGPGGTPYAVEYWSKGKVPVDIIDPLDPEQDREFNLGEPPVQDPFPVIYTAAPSGVRTTVAALLLLRFKGYETMSEKDFEEFYQKLIAALAMTLAEKGWFPARYGFGSNYLFVWDKLSASNDSTSTGFVREAGLAAMEFLELLRQGEADHKARLEYVLCLDVAPVQIMINPLLNQYAHEGVALSKLGVLTRAVSSGFIHATEAFASLVAFEKIQDFRCSYFGSAGSSLQSPGTRLYHLAK